MTEEPRFEPGLCIPNTGAVPAEFTPQEQVGAKFPRMGVKGKKTGSAYLQKEPRASWENLRCQEISIDVLNPRSH